MKVAEDHSGLRDIARVIISEAIPSVGSDVPAEVTQAIEEV